MTTGVVVGSILLARDQKFGVEELAVGAGSDLVDGGRVKIDEESTGNVLSTAGLGEESLVRASIANILEVGVRTTIGAEAVLEEVAIFLAVSTITAKLDNAMGRC